MHFYSQYISRKFYITVCLICILFTTSCSARAAVKEKPALAAGLTKTRQEMMIVNCKSKFANFYNHRYSYYEQPASVTKVGEDSYSYRVTWYDGNYCDVHEFKLSMDLFPKLISTATPVS